MRILKVILIIIMIILLLLIFYGAPVFIIGFSLVFVGFCLDLIDKHKKKK